MKRRYPIDPNRPICVNIGCEKLVHLISRSSTGKPTYRPLCDACRKPKNCAREGVIGVKKDYCENRDGRLGHKCTATIMGYHQLDLDHIDGNHYNNVPENIQTLCKNCHAWKSHENKDHLNFMRNPEFLEKKLTKILKEVKKIKLDSKKNGLNIDFTGLNESFHQFANRLEAAQD